MLRGCKCLVLEVQQLPTPSKSTAWLSTPYKRVQQRPYPSKSTATSYPVQEYSSILPLPRVQKLPTPSKSTAASYPFQEYRSFLPLPRVQQLPTPLPRVQHGFQPLTREYSSVLTLQRVQKLPTPRPRVQQHPTPSKSTEASYPFQEYTTASNTIPTSTSIAIRGMELNPNSLKVTICCIYLDSTAGGWVPCVHRKGPFCWW